MAEKKFSTMIFLLAAFIFLTMFISMWIYGIYVDNASYAKKTSTNTIGCTSYSFDVKNIFYSDSILSFDIENTIGDEFTDLIVEKKGDEAGAKSVQLYNFQMGMQQHIDIINFTGIIANDEIIFYPKGCKGTNEKKYTIS